MAHPLILVSAEEPCMVPLLHHDECDPWLVVLLQLNASLTDGKQLMVQDLQEGVGERTSVSALCLSYLKTNTSTVYATSYTLWL